jgi:hypothetical protein
VRDFINVEGRLIISLLRRTVKEFFREKVVLLELLVWTERVEMEISLVRV